MRWLITVLLLLSGAAIAAPYHAAPSLIADRESIGADGAITLGLRLEVAPGWHVYWRNPGDAGLPPDLTFTLPPGARAGATVWPAPDRVAEDQLTTYALTGDVLLAVPVTAPASRALAVTLHASWLVCEKICVPEQATLRLDLPVGTGAPSAAAALFRAAAAHAPRSAPWDAKIDAAGVLHVSGPDLGPATVAGAWFAADTPDLVGASDPQNLTLSDGALSLTLGKRAASKPLSGLLVLRDPGGVSSAYAITAVPGDAPMPAPAPGIWRGLGLALVGGLLLNVMPCVFPVLAMKVAGLARLGGDRSHARAEGAAYLLGVMASFCVVGLTLLALRRVGELVGWGFQFQNPAFVAVMAFVLFSVGLNFSGVFSIAGGRLQGVGQSVAGRGDFLGAVATGALAVLVATPCTVPFMGAAIAAALAAPVWLGVAVFATLGIGLALPYLLLTWVPSLRRMLPRPGAWMERARQALAFPIYATVAWLAWVLAQQTGPDGVLILGAGCVALAFAAWLLGLSQGRRAPLAVAAVLAVATFAATATLRAAPPADAADDSGDRFTTARLAALREAKKPVFVDMSAAWCLTCLVNERVALRPAAVRDAFARGGVTLLRGDWTFADPDITRFLREHGSDGVPLYVFFPGGDRPATVLPSLLTPGIVLDALATAPSGA